MKVSIIVPTYNRLPQLADVLESIAVQGMPTEDYEVIIVNDHGESVQPVTELYSEMDIRVLDLQENGRHVRARNEGLKVARGEFILLIDDDDMLLPGHMDRMFAEIQDADFVFSDVEIVDFEMENGVRVPTKRFHFAYEFDPAFMRGCSTFVSSGCLYRRRIHDVIGEFDEGVYNYWDWDFIIRVMEKFTVKRLPVASVLYEYSTGGSNASRLTEQRGSYLIKLCEKHQLGEITQKNFFVLLEEPKLKSRQAASTVVWDGEPIVSRYARESGK